MLKKDVLSILEHLEKNCEVYGNQEVMKIIRIEKLKLMGER